MLASQNQKKEENIPDSHPVKVQKEDASIVKDAPSFSRKKRKADDIEVKMLKLLEGEKEQNRHISFFHGVLPSLNEFDEEQTLEFQIGVLQLIKKIKKSKTGVSVAQYLEDTQRQFPTYESPQTFQYTVSAPSTSTATYPQNNQACISFNRPSYPQYPGTNLNVSTPLPSPSTVCSPASSSQSTYYSEDTYNSFRFYKIVFWFI